MNKDFHENQIKYSFLKDYFEGEFSEEKKEQITAWLEDKDHQYRLEHCLRELWNETDPDKVTPPKGYDLILDRIHHKINLLQPGLVKARRATSQNKSIHFNSILKNLSRIAAILLLPVMVYLCWEVADQKMWEKSQAEVVYNEFICPLGARSHFILPDGTKGWLNNGSQLKYPSKFTEKIREVELTGEAYFDVVHNKRRPFIINTDGLDVKVTGTKLNVYAYPDDKYQSFTLVDGSIEIIDRDEGEERTILKMRPGQHAVYAMSEDGSHVETSENGSMRDDAKIDSDVCSDKVDKSAGHSSIQKSDALAGKIQVEKKETSLYTGWKEGKLVLRNDPMPMMLKRIERWYNVKFNIADERIDEYTYWATFEEESLDQVLKMLALTGPIKFDKKPRELLSDGTYKKQKIDVLWEKQNK